MRILLVEDDENLAKALADILSKHNYLVDVSTDGELAWEMIHVVDYDLVLLNVNLPKLDGIRLCRRVRDHNQQVPVMLMTVRDSVTDKLLGLESGADDYLVKPFDMQELLARIRVLSRRFSELSTTILACGKLKLNPQMREICYDGNTTPFSRKEYLLIELFLQHPHRVFSRSDNVIGLGCTKSEVAALEPFTISHYIRTETPDYELRDIENFELSADPSPLMALPYAIPITTASVPVEEEQIPTGEINIRRGAIVEATDGEVGRVDEFLLEPTTGHITHLVLREKHLWATQEISIPVKAIERISGNIVLLKLDKHAVAALPKIAIHRNY